MYWYPEYTFWKQNNTYAEFYKDEAIDMLYLSLAVFAADRLILRETGEDERVFDEDILEKTVHKKENTRTKLFAFCPCIY